MLSGVSPDAITPNSRFASGRAISGVQGDPRLPVVSLHSGVPRPVPVGLGSADPRPDAEASHLLIPQDHFASVPWGQGIDRPFSNLAAHGSAVLSRSPGITGV
jgi:hypothetical protein